MKAQGKLALMRIFIAVIMSSLAIGGGVLVYQHNRLLMLPKREKGAAAIPSVEVTKVQKRTILDRAELVGNLEASSEVEIHPRSSGYITHLPYGIGDFVEKGKVVVELDASAAREVVAKSEAALKVAEAQLLSQKAKSDLAEKEIRRHRELRRMGVSTQQQIEAAEAESVVAKSQVELEKAHVAQAQAELLGCKLALEETRIIAPIAGFVAERACEVGDLAQSDKSILKLVKLDTVRTVVHVVEKDYDKVMTGQHADIRVEAINGQHSFQGKVVRKAPVLETETRTAAVHIDIVNDRLLLRPGMHARATLTFRRQSAERVISIDALLDRENRSQVLVVRGTPPTLQLQTVIAGIVDGPLVEIVSGLTANDRVVTLGTHMVKSGQVVNPIEVPLPGEPLEEPTPPVQTARVPVGG